MPYAVEKYASGPQERETFADYGLAYDNAQEKANFTGEEFAVFDGDHCLLDVVDPLPKRWLGAEVVERVESDLAYAVTTLVGAKQPAVENDLWRAATHSDALLIDRAIDSIMDAMRFLGGVDK